MKYAALAGLLGAGVFVAGASAGIVHFVNPAPGQPGHYAWNAGLPGAAGIWLDITQPSHQQLNVQSGNAVGQIAESTFDGFLAYHAATGPGPVARIAGYYWDFISVADGLPHGAEFPREHSYFLNHAYFYEVEEPDYAGGPYFPPGERRFIGVRTDGGNHGWIEVELNYPGFAVFAWAYETQPGVPILAGQIPAPGAAVLAVAFGLSVRRRKA